MIFNTHLAIYRLANARTGVVASMAEEFDYYSLAITCSVILLLSFVPNERTAL
jgi:hypothetical protein